MAVNDKITDHLSKLKFSVVQLKYVQANLKKNVLAKFNAFRIAWNLIAIVQHIIKTLIICFLEEKTRIISNLIFEVKVLRTKLETTQLKIH